MDMNESVELLNWNWSSGSDDDESSDEQHEHEEAGAGAGGRLPQLAPTSKLHSLCVGCVYSSKQEAIDAVKAHSCATGKKLIQKTSCSNSDAVYFICADAVDLSATAEARKGMTGAASKKQVLKANACTGSAVVRRVQERGATKEKDGVNTNTGKWRIAKVQPHINCGGQLTLSAEQIADVVYENVASNRGISAEDIGTLARQKYPHAVPPSTRMLNRARNLVLDMLDIKYNESFTVMKLWGEAAVAANPGAIFKFNTVTLPSGEKQFNAAAFALPVATLEKACLPISAMDGTHSRHRWYDGIYLTFTLLTSEGTTLLVAWACVKSESEASWTWFVQVLREAGLDVFLKENKVVISDRDKGLLTALTTITAYHFMCLWHVLQNVYKACGSTKDFVLGHRGALFWTVAKSWTKFNFDVNMATLQEENNTAHAYLKNLDPAKWTVMGAHEAGFGLHGRLTSQFAESENAAASKTRTSARFLPPTFFFDSCLRRAHTRLALLRERIANSSLFLTDRANAMLAGHIQSAAPMRVEWTAQNIATVFAGSAPYIVKFLPEGISCACKLTLEHACGCPHSWKAAHDKGYTYSTFVENFVADFHKRSCVSAALNATVVSLPTLPIELHLMTAPPNMEPIVAPPRKKKKGRKSLKKRHKSSVEMTQTQTQTNSQLR